MTDTASLADDFPLELDENAINNPLLESTRDDPEETEEPPRSAEPSSASTDHSSQPSNHLPTRGYHDNLEEHTFGIIKKGSYIPCSDFQFDIEAEVICHSTSSSGYIVNLTPSRGGETRLCFFPAESTNKKAEFVKSLNASYKSACLQCTFTDKELSEYVQHKKRISGSIPRKNAVHKIGKQEDGTWVFTSSVHLSKSGELLEMHETQYICIGQLFQGAGVAGENQECDIELPLLTDPLRALLEALRVHLAHNFMPCVLTMASAVMLLHYQTFLKKFKSCPVPLAFGESGTGKTTALWSGMSLFGAYKKYVWSKISKEKALQLCSQSCVPIGIDDPQSKNDINRLIIDLFNGAQNATFAHGSNKPSTSCLIAANFTTSDQQRYASRCLMIEFSLPAPPLCLGDVVELGELWDDCSSCVGFCVSLGQKFFELGIREVDEKILPNMRAAVGDRVTPRALPSYAILYWFSVELLKEANLGELEEELDEHFNTKVLECAIRLQGRAPSETNAPNPSAASTFSADIFGKELLACLEGLGAAKINTFLRTNTTYNRQRAYAVLLESVPGLSPATKRKLRSYVKDRERGVHNNPRPFSTPQMAAQGIVPTGNTNCKSSKCTIIIATEFSQQVQDALEKATGDKTASGGDSDNPRDSPSGKQGGPTISLDQSSEEPGNSSLVSIEPSGGEAQTTSPNLPATSSKRNTISLDQSFGEPGDPSHGSIEPYGKAQTPPPKLPVSSGETNSKQECTSDSHNPLPGGTKQRKRRGADKCLNDDLSSFFCPAKGRRLN